MNRTLSPTRMKGKQQKKPLEFPTDMSGMERLVQEGGFEDMDFEHFMKVYSPQP